MKSPKAPDVVKAHSLDRRSFLKKGAAVLGASILAPIGEPKAWAVHTSSVGTVELEFMSASEAAEAIQNGLVSCVDLMQLILRRIEQQQVHSTRITGVQREINAARLRCCAQGVETAGLKPFRM